MSHWFREGASDETLSCTHTGGALSKPVAHSENLAHSASLALYAHAVLVELTVDYAMRESILILFKYVFGVSHWFREGASDETLSCTHTGGRPL